MTTLAILLILMILVGYGLKEYYQVKLHGGPHSSPQSVVDELTEFLSQYSPRGRFLDLGSGWGGLVLQLARKMPEWQIDGIEASPTPWFIANCRSIGKSFGNYRFFIGRMEKFLLQNYDIIYINQPVKNLNLVLPRLVRALQNDAFIISYPHPLPRIPDADVLISDQNDRLYLYRGTDALAFLNANKESEETAADVQPEPAVEPTPVPADQAEPNDDNAFEQQPNDVEPIMDPASAEVTDTPPANDGFAEQGRLPFQHTD